MWWSRCSSAATHIAFYRQFASAGLAESMKIVSPTFGLGNEQVVLGGEERRGSPSRTPTSRSSTHPTNQQFVDKWHGRFGEDYDYITDSAVTVWKRLAAVGRPSRRRLRRAREGHPGAGERRRGDSPSGARAARRRIAPRGAERLHRETEGEGFKVISTEESVPPAFEQEKCDLKATRRRTSSSRRRRATDPNRPRARARRRAADAIANLALGILSGVATLVLISLGLAVVFGMMGIINFAHGEFLMLGAFTTLTGVRAGLPLPLAMLLGAPGGRAFGLLIERALIQWLYGRLEATILATFGSR
jgi:hypothetical protein